MNVQNNSEKNMVEWKDIPWKKIQRAAAIPNSECSQRYKRLDVFTGKGFAMKIAN
jgi:hypothetical protein